MGSLLFSRVFPSLLFGLFVSIFSVSSVEAVTEGIATGEPVSSEPVRVATVNVQNLQLLKQEDNVFTLEFNISNREGVQPKIVYAVNLTRKVGAEDEEVTEAAIVDKHVYNDLINLGEKQSVRKQITYEAPDFLKGEYSLEVEARNPDGMPFGTSEVPGTIFLYGSGEGIQMDSESCSLTVDGENPQKRYSLSQGVDISSEETLVVHCMLANTFRSVRSVTPLFETRYRSAFGKIVATNKQESISMSPGQDRISFERSLPKVKEPQAYDAILTFVDDRGKSLSSPVAFHYVLRGESATIQNVTLDKNSYKKGDTAAATFFWTGSADNFPNARAQSTGEVNGVTISLDVTDAGKSACAAELIQKVDSSKGMSGVEQISIPITADCFEPKVRAKLLNENGRVLAEASYDLGVAAMGSKPMSQESEVSDAGSKTNIVRMVVIGIVLLPILLGLAYIINRRRSRGMAVFLAVFIAVGFLAGVQPVRADTFLVRTTLGNPNHYVDSTFSVNLDKNSYLVNERISVTGRYVSSICNNGWDFTAMESSTTHTKLEVTVNSIRQTILEKNRDLNKYDCAAAVIPVGCTSPSCRPNIPPSNTYCGPAHAVYPSTARAFSGAFCRSGAVTNPNSSTWSFPSPGGRRDWSCYKVPNASGSKNFSGHAVAGNYTADFYGLAEVDLWGVTFSNFGFGGIPYQVIGGTQDGQCGPAAQQYPNTATAYSGAFCNSYYPPSPTPAFPAANGNASWTCRGYGSGSKSASCSASRRPAVVQTLRACLDGCGTGSAPLTNANRLHLTEGGKAFVAACLLPSSSSTCSDSAAIVSSPPALWIDSTSGVIALNYINADKRQEITGLNISGQPAKSSDVFITSGSYNTSFGVDVDCVEITACNDGWDPAAHCPKEENFCSKECGPGIITEKGTQTCNEHPSWTETPL